MHYNSGNSGNSQSFGVYMDGASTLYLVFLGESLSTNWSAEAYTFTATSTSHHFYFRAELYGSDVS